MYQGIKHDSVMVIGSGYSIKQYRRKILRCIELYNCKTIGINKMTSLCIPDYHLWTNKKQYVELGSCIRPEKSNLLFGIGIPKSIIRKHFAGKYISVVYTDNKGKFMFDEKHIKGRFRTAGCLAICVAYLMDAKTIFVVGMDGFTLHSRRSLSNKTSSQHCYGQGHTDDASWEGCLKKDAMVANSLNELSKYVNFQIITPTKFIKYYDGSVLGHCV